MEDRENPIVEPELFSEVLKRRASAEPAARAIVLVDAAGKVYATSSSAHPLGEDLSQTNAYRILSTQTGLKNHISPSYRDPFGDAEIIWAWTMDFAQRMEDPDGNFSGYVLIEIDRAVLYSFYVNLPEESGRVLGLVGEDGIIRISNTQSAVGMNIKSLLNGLWNGGVRIGETIPTGERRVFAYSKSSAAPLLAYVGTPVAEVFATWFHLAVIVAVALLVLGAALVAIGIILGKYFRDHKALIHNRVERERERQEREFLEAILNTGGALVAVTDTEGKPIVVNPAFRELFGVDEARGGLLVLPKVLDRSMSDLIGSLPLETTVRTKDRRRRQRELSWTVTAIRDRNDAPKNLVAIGFDNTDRREAELAIYQSGKLITLGEMATGLAHEINQPLGAIVLTLDYLQARLQTGSADSALIRKHVDIMTTQAERAARVIEHMRIYSRRSDGTAHPLDPAEAVEGALTIAGQQIESAGIVIEKNLRPETSLVRAELTVVEQILINLLLNARDAIIERREREAPEMTGWIAIDLSDRDTGSVCLSVRDNGGGIPREILDRVFEPFFTTKPTGKGTGLGLALSYGMAQNFGGRIEVSNNAEGAEFRLFLPQAIRAQQKTIEIMTDRGTNGQ